VRQLLRAADEAAMSTNSNRTKLSKLPAKYNRDPRESASLIQGLRILSLFTDDKPIWGIKEAADALEAARSTVHRYVSTLVRLGQLESTANRKYRRRV
jgi:DNA-binding MarR family transcriptional regulator